MNPRRAGIAKPLSDGSAMLRVLLADPDKSLLAVYRESLSSKGFEVTTASSGLECVACLREAVPDLLVMEPQLPWGGGDGVLAIMLEILELATVPVMVLTACRDLRVLGGIAPFPIIGWHVKPLASDRLANMLRNLLHYHRHIPVSEKGSAGLFIAS